MNQTIEIKAVSPTARDLLISALGWLRRIEARKATLPPLFMDNIDIKPLCYRIEDFLAGRISEEAIGPIYERVQKLKGWNASI